MILLKLKRRTAGKANFKKLGRCLKGGTKKKAMSLELGMKVQPQESSSYMGRRNLRERVSKSRVLGRALRGLSHCLERGNVIPTETS